MARAFASLCALCLLFACNVASVAEQPNAIPQNECPSNSDCTFGSCVGVYCGTTEGSFDTILFEVSTPSDGTKPSDGTSSSGVQFLKPVTDVLGIVKREGKLDLALDLVAQVAGEVTLGARKCQPKFVGAKGMVAVTANDSSIPALISIIPSAGALGLFSLPAAARATTRQDSFFGFNLSVPPGNYDIYVEPDQQQDDTCIVPPELLRGQAISGAVKLNIALPEPQTFELHVTWPPADGALDSWSVDMLDPIGGRAISNVAPLIANGTDYVAKLSYLPVVGDQLAPDELLRLAPPPGVTAPTLLFARSGLGLFSAASGTVNQFTSLPTPVHVVGAVTANSTPTPVAATVTLVATKITGMAPGIFASFVRTMPTSADGSFELDLLPGTYRVAAVPNGSPNAVAVPFAEVSTEWTVASSPAIQAGRVIELSPTLEVNGVALDPSGSIKMVGAQVQAMASPASITTDVLHQSLGETVYVPRATSTTVDASGKFELRVDSGSYDFSVRPRASSGFAWLVRPNVAVGTTPLTTAGLGFDTLTLPVPVVYHGRLTIPGATAGVAGALIGAYVYLKGGEYTADPTQADSVVQIGESRSEADGMFTLLIPAELNQMPN